VAGMRVVLYAGHRGFWFSVSGIPPERASMALEQDATGRLAAGVAA
jgi:hypothetical protein